jgi:hypothetical protein
MADKGIKIRGRLSRKGVADKIFDDPSADNCIVGQDKKGSQDSEIACSPCPCMYSVIGQNRIVAGFSSQGHLRDHNRDA